MDLKAIVIKGVGLVLLGWICFNGLFALLAPGKWLQMGWISHNAQFRNLDRGGPGALVRIRLLGILILSGAGWMLYMIVGRLVSNSS